MTVDSNRKDLQGFGSRDTREDQRSGSRIREVIMVAGSVVHAVPAARPTTTLQPTELSNQLRNVEEGGRFGVDHRKQFKVERRTVALGRCVYESVGAELLPNELAAVAVAANFGDSIAPEDLHCLGADAGWVERGRPGAH